jgi:hypothetical protein
MEEQAMRRFDLATVLVFAAWIVAAGATGCSNSDTVIQPLTSETQTDVQAGAEILAVSTPSIDATEETVVSLMAEVVPEPLGGRSGPFPPSMQDSLTCVPVFDLGNGLSGTCLAEPTGEVIFTFGGTVDAEGESLSVDGTLVVALAADQPATGTGYDIELAATMSGPPGVLAWSSTGSLVVDEAGAVVDFGLALAGTVSPAGGQEMAVSAVLDAAQLELTLVGPRGGVLRIAMDRAAMTGAMTLNGLQVAAVSIVDGCAVIDPIVPGLEDQTICP